jgi:hypothetical protein
MKKSKMVLTTLMLLLGVTFFNININNVFAWYNTLVQSKTFYCPYGGEPVAKMGTTTQYGYIGPAAERSPQFYSAIMARSIVDPCDPRWLYFFDDLRIEVSGVYPNGETIPGDHFGDLSVLVSPDDSGVEQEILRVIFDILVDFQPAGLSAILKNTISQGGATTEVSVDKAWAEWPGGGLVDSMEKGLRFGYELNVDPVLEGTYIINIHYSADVWIALPPTLAEYVGTLDLYDTVTYEYVNTPLAPSTPSGPASGYRGTSYSYTTSTTDPNGDSLKYEFDWGDGTITLTDWYTSGATASTSHSWGSLGTYYVKVRAQDSTGAWSDWSSPLTVNIVNRAPNTPSAPSGPTTVYRNVWYTYSTCATDPDGDSIRYHLNATGPGNPYQNTTIWGDSGTPMIWNLLWEPTDSPGTYLIQTWVEDVHGALSPMSSLSVTMINRAPNTPSQPAGSTTVYRNVWYTYSTSTTDPDGDNVQYQFEFTGPSLNVSFTMQTGSITVMWENEDPLGTYQVRVRAQDVYEEWSDWSPYLTVNLIEPPLVDLVIRVPQAPPEGVKIWVDGNLYTAYENSPVSITVVAGQHTIEAERGFLKEEWMPGMYFIYAFDHWSDGSEANPRTINLTSDKTLTAYYLRSKWGILACEIK